MAPAACSQSAPRLPPTLQRTGNDPRRQGHLVCAEGVPRRRRVGAEGVPHCLICKNQPFTLLCLLLTVIWFCCLHYRTCLHWACKRGHTQIVSYLLDAGANKDILTNKGESAAQLTMKRELRAMLGVDEDSEPVINGESTLPFLPNYLANPSFPYVENRESKSTEAAAAGSLTGRKPSLTSQQQNTLAAGPPATFQPLFFTGAYPINEQGRERDRHCTRHCLPGSTLSSTASDYNLSFLFSEQQLLDKEVARLQNYQELEFVLQKGDPALSSVPATLTERPCYNQGAATLTY
ncbi:ankyrin repeat domain-containing protein 40 [Chiloscyllium plagiosum]|uniref:ankyrin repeat domain-containing protein 40 n=1 Tax=Chiloscyllium plagiosum TaxID=36176 RepID=UPI001CB855FF|nr:ankyrin repeat domain-containing protein 40 [Chiloscyllium plagiosum]